MKRILFLIGCLSVTVAGFSQKSPGDTVPAYIRTGVIPAFTTYAAPDSTVFTRQNINKGKPVLLMIFSPDCSHCQNVTKEIVKNIAHFKKAQIIMITWLPYADMTAFYKDYKIANYPEIKMAWDSKYFFLPYYNVRNYPKLIVYDKKGKYVKEFQGDVDIDDVWKTMNKK